LRRAAKDPKRGYQGDGCCWADLVFFDPIARILGPAIGTEADERSLDLNMHFWGNTTEIQGVGEVRLAYSVTHAKSCGPCYEESARGTTYGAEDTLHLLSFPQHARGVVC
jgi:hypothetical protein